MSSLPSHDPIPAGPRLPPRPKGLAFVLSALTLLMYCSFVLLVGYDKPLLGTTIVPGLSWGVLLGALVIVAAWALTFIYVVASNRRAAGK